MNQFRVGDPVNDLGIALRRPIPKGQERADWMRTPAGLEEVTVGLRSVGYTGNLLARAVFDLSLGEIRMPLSIVTATDLEALEGGSHA